MITAEVLSCVLNTYGIFCIACPAGKQTVDSSENVSKLRSNNNKQFFRSWKNSGRVMESHKINYTKATEKKK